MNEKLTIIMYGAPWCGDCIRAKEVLNRNQFVYQWVDIDQDPEAKQFVLRVNQGKCIIPTIIFPDDSILVEPSNTQLLKKLSLIRDP
jgi:glutaredoxin-like protein